MKQFLKYISKGDRPFWIVMTIAFILLFISSILKS